MVLQTKLEICPLLFGFLFSLLQGDFLGTLYLLSFLSPKEHYKDTHKHLVFFWMPEKLLHLHLYLYSLSKRMLGEKRSGEDKSLP